MSFEDEHKGSRGGGRGGRGGSSSKPVELSPEQKKKLEEERKKSKKTLKTFGIVMGVLVGVIVLLVVGYYGGTKLYYTIKARNAPSVRGTGKGKTLTAQERADLDKAYNERLARN